MRYTTFRPTGRFLKAASMSLFLALPCHGQAGGGAGPTSPAAPAGSGAVESAVISYQAETELARQLAARFCGAGKEKITLKIGSRHFLLGTPNNLTAIQAAAAFEAAVKQLGAQYDKLTDAPVGMDLSAHLAVSAGASAAITAISGAVSAIKTQTTQTASTFTPVDQVLFSDLEREMDSANCSLVTMAYPGTISDAAAKVEAELDVLLEKRAKARSKRDQDDPTKYGNDKELQGLDAELATLEQTLGNETANMNGSSILAGVALGLALTENYHVLTLANAATGGGTRANVYFLVNVLFPAPHPSYNGGAEVAYSLRTMGGEYESADALYFVFGYTKLKEPRLRNQNNRSVTNFSLDNSGSKGPGKPID